MNKAGRNITATEAKKLSADELAKAVEEGRLDISGFFDPAITKMLEVIEDTNCQSV